MRSLTITIEMPLSVARVIRLPVVVGWRLTCFLFDVI